jgi:tetratricopeptide (TPR) repeat protein
MQYLKELLEQEPRHAAGLYLLAAQHVELGLIDRAIVEMEQAIEQDESLEIARLQLGLMLLDRRHVARAKEHLCKLERSADPAWRACATAMVAIADDEWDVAIHELGSPELKGSANKTFAVSMRRLLEKYVRELRQAERSTGEKSAGAGADALGGLLI